MDQTSSNAPVPRRVFKPLYQSTGDVMSDKLAFFHILEELKTQKRTGWVNNKIPHPESISDHMHRMAILALCSEDQNLDIAKCVILAVVHDLAEAQVGDITPDEGISKQEKKQLEEDAMNNFVTEMLHDSPAAKRLFTLWKEYEDQVTPEARFVKDLDLLEMALQAREYERRYLPTNKANPTSTSTSTASAQPIADLDLQPFFNSSIPRLRSAEVKEWGRALEEERSRSSKSEE